MNEIVLELIKSGVDVIVQYNNKTNKLEYILDGFYKSCTVRLYEEMDSLWAQSRYDNVVSIECVEDIVMLNYYWWQKSKDKFNGWENPDYRWLELLKKYDLVKEVNVVKYV